jgi:NADP-dependent 3-hydroxy acid dehydrogenase YdfG
MTDGNVSLGIVITGASSGMGEAVALEMAKDGHIFFILQLVDGKNLSW